MTSDLKKATRGLDAFQAHALEILEKLVSKPKAVFISLGVTVGVLVVIFGTRYWVATSRETRKVELTKIDQVFDEETKVFGKAREQREKKRDALRAAIPSPVKGVSPGTSDVPETPEMKSLDAEIQAMKPDHKKSSEQYKAYFDRNPKSAEGIVAGLKYASFQAEQGQLEEAQKVLESLVEQVQNYSILQVETYLSLISVLEDRDQLDKALEYNSKFLKFAQDEMKPRVLLKQGQLYFLKKDYSQAVTVLNQLLSEHENSTEADRARSLLALIPQQG